MEYTLDLSNLPQSKLDNIIKGKAKKLSKKHDDAEIIVTVSNNKAYFKVKVVEKVKNSNLVDSEYNRRKAKLVKDSVFQGFELEDLFKHMTVNEITQVKQRILVENNEKNLEDLTFKLNDVIIDDWNIKMASEGSYGSDYQVMGELQQRGNYIDVNIIFYVSNKKIGDYDYEGPNREDLYSAIEELYKKYGNKYITNFDVDEYGDIEIDFTN